MLYGETPAVAGAMAFDVNIVRKIFFCKFCFCL